MQPPSSDLWHGTTILTVRKGGTVAIGGDGQVTIGQTIVKSNARKVRRLAKGDVIGGFAGATADAFTLFERLEAKLEQYPGQLTRAAVELAKDWRTDRFLRRLEAMMIVADKDVSLVLTGTGDVLEPEAGAMGIGSGGNFALAAARALIDGPLDAEAIVRRSLDIAADITDLGELGGFDLEERRLREPRQPARNLGLADAGRANHQDVLRQHLLAQLVVELEAAPAVAQRDGDRAFGVGLADDVAVEFGNDFAGREVGHCVGTMEATSVIGRRMDLMGEQSAPEQLIMPDPAASGEARSRAVRSAIA